MKPTQIRRSDRWSGALLCRLVVVVILVGVSVSCASGADAEVRRWTVASDPETVIGGMEGDSVYLFQRVRGARMLPDDRVGIERVEVHRIEWSAGDGG